MCSIPSSPLCESIFLEFLVSSYNLNAITSLAPDGTHPRMCDNFPYCKTLGEMLKPKVMRGLWIWVVETRSGSVVYGLQMSTREMTEPW